VFFTPLASTTDNALCEQLHTYFGKDLKCSSTNETAIKLPVLSERFSTSTSSQYYAHLDELSSVIGMLQQRLCGTNEYCKDVGRQFSSANYLDIDYDTISHAVVLTAGWPSAENEAREKETWNEAITLPSKDATVEIGVLSNEANTDPEDIQFGGFLTVLGQDDRPSTLPPFPVIPRY
jgi:hypothetical protein